MSKADTERVRRWRWEHPVEAIKRQLVETERKKKRNLIRKTKVLTHYGNGKCACVVCGESRLACLSIDHVIGGGNRMRKALKLRSSESFYKWLEVQSYPAEYQTLCMNCQFVKRFERDEEKNHEQRAYNHRITYPI